MRLLTLELLWKQCERKFFVDLLISRASEGQVTAITASGDKEAADAFQTQEIKTITQKNNRVVFAPA